VGEGFGIPLVIRYLLEVAADVAEGDRGAAAAAAPDLLQRHALRPIRAGRHRDDLPRPTGTGERPARGHEPPETVEWPEHSAWVGSVERLDLLQAMSSRVRTTSR
jgi:hypothetical protein